MFPSPILAQAAPPPGAEEAMQAMDKGFTILGMTPHELWDLTLEIWIAGGWLMIPLAFLAFFIYFESVALIMRLNQAKLNKVKRATWEQWVDRPEEGSGHIGEAISYVVGDRTRLDEDALLRLEAIRTKIIPPVNMRIIVLGILVAVAPLVGLLGTVEGMLATFRALAGNTGQTVELVADGIRVALITTQTGLMIAIPGYIFISFVVRKRNQYLGFLAELESVVTQRIHAMKNGNQAA